MRHELGVGERIGMQLLQLPHYSQLTTHSSVTERNK
jgi:hypothetical protein